MKARNMNLKKLSAHFLILLLLPAIALATACSSAESDTESSDAMDAANAFAAKYAELREQGKSHKAATELAELHVDGSIDGGRTDDDDGRSAMDAAVVLARFSTSDGRGAVQREQAAEELTIRFQSRNLDADRALGLLHKIAPESSISERREAAKDLARLSRADDWGDGNTKEAAEKLTLLITGDALDADRRIEAAKELARRSNDGDLDTDDALNLMNDLAPEMSINERRAAAGNLVRLSKSETWDAETTKQAAEETFRLVTGDKLDYEKRSDAAVDLTGEAIKKFGGDSFEDRDVDMAGEVIKKTLKGDLNMSSVSDILNSK